MSRVLHCLISFIGVNCKRLHSQGVDHLETRQVDTAGAWCSGATSFLNIVLACITWRDIMSGNVRMRATLDADPHAKSKGRGFNLRSITAGLMM